MNQRPMRGLMSHHAGLAAEQRVAQEYRRRGCTILHKRWRGAGGEIDLIARDASGVVFVEVKQSRDFALAAERLGARQMRRIAASAAEFLAGEPDGALTSARFDVALVDGRGALQIIENAFGHDG